MYTKTDNDKMFHVKHKRARTKSSLLYCKLGYNAIIKDTTPVFPPAPLRGVPFGIQDKYYNLPCI